MRFTSRLVVGLTTVLASAAIAVPANAATAPQTQTDQTSITMTLGDPSSVERAEAQLAPIASHQRRFVTTGCYQVNIVSVGAVHKGFRRVHTKNCR